MQIGLVLPGGGARGAYEAGALSVLIPALEARGAQGQRDPPRDRRGHRDRARGELLSFIFFDEVFIERLLELGRAHARRWLAAHPGFWSLDAGEAGFDAPEVSAEAVALDEFRAARRRH